MRTSCTTVTLNNNGDSKHIHFDKGQKTDDNFVTSNQFELTNKSNYSLKC